MPRHPLHRFPFPALAILSACLLAFPSLVGAQQPPAAAKKALDALAQSARQEELLAACKEIRDSLASFIDANKRDAWDDSPPAADLDTPEKLREKIKTLDRAETIDAFIRHSAEFALRYPEHPDFAKNLWQLASIVDISERSAAPSVFRKRFLPELLAACNQLPLDNLYHIEGKFLAARHLHRAGKFKQEEALLRELASQEGLEPTVSSLTLAQLGRNLETQKRFDDALDIYAEMIGTEAPKPQDCDALLRSALINLEQGRLAEASKLIAKLAEIDPEIRGEALAGQELASLLKLHAQDGALAAYWKQSDKWWPAWTKLRKNLGDERPEGEVRIVDLPSLRDTGQALAAAIGAGDKARFLDILDLIMHGLRWSPTGIGEAGAALCFLTPRAIPEMREPVYEFALSLCEGFEPGDRGLERSAMLYQTICYSDLGMPEKAVGVIDAFRAGDDSPDDLSETMLRLWAHLAVGGHADMKEPLEGLEKLLTNGKNIESRPQSVLYLAQIYRKLERFDDEGALLERELKHPAIRSDERLFAAMTERAKEIADGPAGVEGFADAIAEWRDKHAPGWLQFALPLGLDDPRLKDVDLTELINDPSTARLTAEERVVVELLAASSDALPLVTRDRAFRTAFAGLFGDSPTHSDARSMLRDILRDDRFPKPLQQMLLIFSLDEALASSRKRDITSALTHPLLDRDNERLAAAIQSYGRFTSTDLNDGDSLLSCYEDLAKNGVGSAELTVIGEVFGRLLQIGALDKAAQVQSDVADWKLDPDVRQDKNALRLAFIKSLRRARGAVPFGEAMRKLLGEHISADKLESLDGPNDYREGLDLKRLSEEDGFALMLKRGSDPKVLQTAPSFWFDLAELMPRDDRQVDFSFKLLESLLQSDIPDLEKSFTILSTPAIIDTDSPANLSRMIVMFDEHRDSESQPQSHAAMTIVEIQSRELRQGKEIDLRDMWRGLDHPALSRIQTSATIRNLIARGEKTKLRSTLDSMAANELLSPGMIDLTWPALIMAKMEDEAELAKEVAVDNLPAFVAGAARQLDFGMIRMVFDTAKRVGDPDLVPEKWFAYLDSQIKAERDRYSLHVIESEFREDWESLAKWSSLAVEKFPTYYNYYRPQGIAFHKLGKKAEAIAALEIYTKFSKDEAGCRAAEELLEELRK